MSFYLDMISDTNYTSINTPPQYQNYNEANTKMLHALDEAYYGKTDEIRKIEKKIGEIREKYQTQPMKVHTSSEMRQLEDLFCDAFGFECCSIHIDPNPSYNACTIPVSNSVFDFRDFSKYIVADKKKGFKYKKEANVYLIINITKGLMFSSVFTDAEVTAIILHEVGHNFQNALSGRLRALSMPGKIINAILGPIIMIMVPEAGPFRNAYIDLIKKIEKDYKVLANAYFSVKDFVTTVLAIGIGILGIIGNISILFNPIAVIKQIPQHILSHLNISELLDLPSGIKGESLADNFVSTYGYGPELTEALSKMHKLSGGYTPDQVMRDMGIIGAYFDLLMLPDKIIANIFDPHPNTIARLNDQYLYLKEELTKNENNPKMKKELQSQLNEIQKSMDKFVDAEEAGFFFSNRYDKALLMLCGGDPRLTAKRINNEEIDAAEKKAEEQLKALKRK